MIDTSWIELFFERVEERKRIINLGIGEPDFGVPEDVKNEAYRAMMNGKNRYTHTAGIQLLRELLAEKYGAMWKIDLTYSNIILTPGASNALFMAIASIIRHGDEVLIPTPTYPSYDALVRLLGGKPVEVPTILENGFKPNIEKIIEYMSDKTKLIIINTPTNPTGYVYDNEIISSLVDIAMEKDVYLLSDEVYEKFVYDVKFISMNKFRSRFDKIITVHSFSKSLAMTGWRLGFIIGNNYLINRVSKLQTYINACPPSIAQYAALHALKSPYVSENINLVVKSYKERRDLIYKLLRDKGFKTSLPSGAFYIFPEIPVKMKSYEFCEKLLEKKGVVTMPGRAFGEAGEGYFRITYAVNPELIIQAVELIEKFVLDIN